MNHIFFSLMKEVQGAKALGVPQGMSCLRMVIAEMSRTLTMTQKVK